MPNSTDRPATNVVEDEADWYASLAFKIVLLAAVGVAAAVIVFTPWGGKGFDLFAKLIDVTRGTILALFAVICLLVLYKLYQRDKRKLERIQERQRAKEQEARDNANEERDKAGWRPGQDATR